MKTKPFATIELQALNEIGADVKTQLYALIVSHTRIHGSYTLTDELASNLIGCTLNSIKKAKKALKELGKIIEVSSNTTNTEGIIKTRKVFKAYGTGQKSKEKQRIISENQKEILRNAFLTDSYTQDLIKRVRNGNIEDYTLDKHIHNLLRHNGLGEDELISIYIISSYYEKFNQTKRYSLLAKIGYINTVLDSKKPLVYLILSFMAKYYRNTVKSIGTENIDSEMIDKDCSQFVTESIIENIFVSSPDKKDNFNWIHQAISNYFTFTGDDNSKIDFLKYLMTDIKKEITSICNVLQYSSSSPLVIYDKQSNVITIAADEGEDIKNMLLFLVEATIYNR